MLESVSLAGLRVVLPSLPSHTEIIVIFLIAFQALRQFRK